MYVYIINIHLERRDAETTALTIILFYGDDACIVNISGGQTAEAEAAAAAMAKKNIPCTACRVRARSA